MTFRGAAKTFNIPVGLLQKLVSWSVSIVEVDSGIELGRKKKPVDVILKFAAARQLGLTRHSLKQPVMVLSSDSRPVSWDPAVGPDQK